MLPINLDLDRLRIMLVGNGVGALKRLESLDRAEAKNVAVYAVEPTEELGSAAKDRLVRRMPLVADFEGVDIMLMAGAGEEDIARLVQMAKEHSVLVNVEDRKEYCDFYFPSILRRGDLVVSVSTGGESPALARTIREALEEIFPEDWAGRLTEIAEKRIEWKEAGDDLATVSAKTEEYAKARGWMKDVKKLKPREMEKEAA